MSLRSLVLQGFEVDLELVGADPESVRLVERRRSLTSRAPDAETIVISSVLPIRPAELESSEELIEPVDLLRWRQRWMLTPWFEEDVVVETKLDVRKGESDGWRYSPREGRRSPA
ncbi:MAG: hypothetical protein R2706_15320 [Acidimicrobiales bacterium]